ncbi:PA2169 family four-helix-bundle protein [Hymenobacter sp. YC55]|uniref:PA2169 family four-helix-bundle protein n=1 Tax=Hymenobacter sp. YC55 TaxID=3034019 RepID=UPI0023F61DB1|nr:PA2169 family four-helix-bundle protein [Hymenobacter sp. YC55]MDF7815434.1 PA2169 family four-helix-bundle protein [Hymenobacter sp. YC55]
MNQPSSSKPTGAAQQPTMEPYNSLPPQPATTDSSPLDQLKPLVDQAKEMLSEKSLDGLVEQLPQSVKDAGTKAAASFSKLTTTQKVLGGVLLVAGVRYLTSGKKRQGKKTQSQKLHDKKAKKEVKTLHELLLFVNDRVEGYKKAAAESQDAQRQGYYRQLVGQSERFAQELNGHLSRLGGERETGTTLKGKLYRRLMEATAIVTGQDEQAILAANIHGEKWAIAAYKDALDDHTLSASHQAVVRQYAQAQKTLQELEHQQASHS